jgi:hypothetical protein
MNQRAQELHLGRPCRPRSGSVALLSGVGRQLERDGPAGRGRARPPRLAHERVLGRIFEPEVAAASVAAAPEGE